MLLAENAAATLRASLATARRANFPDEAAFKPLYPEAIEKRVDLALNEREHRRWRLTSPCGQQNTTLA